MYVGIVMINVVVIKVVVTFVVLHLKDGPVMVLVIWYSPAGQAGPMRGHPVREEEDELA